ncbi:hypothetical protein [Micromonospora musae]|uniref:hypothetical protein n=1 Tax=Micromonospora musae TaxID=1894970 RepID=UPI00341AA4DD
MTAACLAATILAAQPASVHAEQRHAPAPTPSAPTTAASGSGEHSVTPAQRARMAGEEPLAEAAVRIRTAARAAKAPGFAGVALRDGTVTVYWKGPVPPASRKMIDQESAKVPVVVRPAAHSAEELGRAADEIRRKLSASGDRSVVSIGYPVTGSGITATVTGAKTPAALADAPVPVTLTRSTPKATEPAATASGPGRRTDAPAAPGTARTSSAGGSMGTLAFGDWPNPSRQDDAVPAWGGAHLINSEATGGNGGWQVRDDETDMVVDADVKWHCTSGFPAIFEGTGQELMVQPLSCGGPQRQFVDASGDAVNVKSTSIAVVPSSGVSLTVPVGGAEPFLYDGDPWTQVGWQISSWEEPVAGQSVCVSAAGQGSFCGATIGDEVGTESALIQTSQGDSNLTVNMTNLGASYEDGPVHPARRPYVLADGSVCNTFAFMDNTGCWQFAFAPGDMGAAVYTVPAEGDDTGVTIIGMLVHQHDGNGQNPTNYHIVGADQIFAAYPNIDLLTSRNDRP